MWCHMEIAQAGATYRTDTPVFLPAAFGLSEIDQKWSDSKSWNLGVKDFCNQAKGGRLSDMKEWWSNLRWLYGKVS